MNKPTDLQEWQKRYECRKCRAIVYSKFANHTSRCSCGAIAVEQAPYMNAQLGDIKDFIDLDSPQVFNPDSQTMAEIMEESRRNANSCSGYLFSEEDGDDTYWGDHI